MLRTEKITTFEPKVIKNTFSRNTKIYKIWKLRTAIFFSLMRVGRVVHMRRADLSHEIFTFQQYNVLLNLMVSFHVA